MAGTSPLRTFWNAEIDAVIQAAQTGNLGLPEARAEAARVFVVGAGEATVTDGFGLIDLPGIQRQLAANGSMPDADPHAVNIATVQEALHINPQSQTDWFQFFFATQVVDRFQHGADTPVNQAIDKSGETWAPGRLTHWWVDGLGGGQNGEPVLPVAFCALAAADFQELGVIWPVTEQVRHVMGSLTVLTK